MQGLMMDMPLLVSGLIQHADRHHGATEIVSKTVEGGIHRYTYRDAHVRARRLANALKTLGVGMNDRVATLAWNGFRHFEIYYAVARACFPTRSPTSPTTPRTRSCSSTRPSRRSSRSSGPS